jgi:enoyl-CoA hydratase/carnithine racemase
MPILVTRPEPGIALVTVSQPERRNALGPQEFHDLAQAWDVLARDEEVHCVVVTGDGDKAFCSGAQLDADFSSVADVDDMVDRALLKTRVFPRPIVAAVNGHCVAGGFELMLSSDLRVASSAAKLGLPEVHWGIVPTGGAAMKLVEQIGHARAMQLMLTGELVSADEALRYGLLNEVVAPEQVLARAMHFARTIAGNSPLAVAHTKRLALAGRAESWQQREPQERRSAAIVRPSPDAAIGRRAFLDKQQPRYTHLF